MSGINNFVSEGELDEARKVRQAEWEKVRKPEDPIEAPVTVQDNRCLHHRLKEQREKKQAELEEAQKLKHMVRGLDSEEVGFLDYVDEMKAAEEKHRRLEEKELIQEIAKAREVEKLQELPLPTATASTKKSPDAAKSKPLSKQAQLISSSIVKRKSSESKSTDDENPAKKKKLSESDNNVQTPLLKNEPSISSLNQNTSSCIVEIGRRPTAIKSIGLLPGLSAYASNDQLNCDDNDSDSSDSSNSSNEDCTNEPDYCGKRKVVIEIKSSARNRDSC